MILECEGKPAIHNPNVAQIRKIIKSLRSYGPSSYASITADDGCYIQVAGGGVTCMIEFFKIDTKERLRAYHNSASNVFPDGTLLVFTAGTLAMKSDEWFNADKVVEVFCAFLEGNDLPKDMYWRQAPA